MRFTKKSDKLGYCLRHSSIKTWQCWDKLGQLEDIEEEIGIDLITLFKILSSKKIYFIDNTGSTTEIRYDEYLYITENNINKCYLEVNGNTAHIGLYFKDYSKTWSLDKNDLTKEELEK